MGKASSLVNHAIAVARNNELIRAGTIATAGLLTGGATAGLTAGMGASGGGALEAGAQLASGQGLANISATQVAAQAAGAAVGNKAATAALTPPPVADVPIDAATDQTQVTTPALVADPVQAERRRKKLAQGRAGTILAGGTGGTSQSLGDASGGQRSTLLGL